MASPQQFHDELMNDPETVANAESGFTGSIDDQVHEYKEYTERHMPAPDESDLGASFSDVLSAQDGEPRTPRNMPGTSGSLFTGSGSKKSPLSIPAGRERSPSVEFTGEKKGNYVSVKVHGVTRIVPNQRWMVVGTAAALCQSLTQAGSYRNRLCRISGRCFEEGNATIWQFRILDPPAGAVGLDLADPIPENFTGSVFPGAGGTSSCSWALEFAQPMVTAEAASAIAGPSPFVYNAATRRAALDRQWGILFGEPDYQR